MMTNESGPLYRVVDASSAITYIASGELDGFFVEPDHALDTDIVFSDVTEVTVHQGQILDDVDIQVVDRRGQVIGSYSYGWLPVVSVAQDAVTLNAEPVPFPQAGSIWHRWASGAPIRSGEWMEYAISAHGSWLHVVQNAWSTKWQSLTRRGSGERCVIDGRRIVGEDSFFCELGESVNGVGGYFGSTLNGFHDCLSYPMPSGRLRELAWHHSEESLARLDRRFVADVVEIAHQYGVQVVFDPRNEQSR